MQLTLHHWFYLYILLVLAALVVLAGDWATLSSRSRHEHLLDRLARARRSPTSTTAPITQTSSSAVSKRTGIWVRKRLQRLLPLDADHARARAGHPDVGDDRRSRRAARGRRRSARGCGCRRPRRRGRRGASPSPPSRWSPRRGSRRRRVGRPRSRSSSASASANGDARDRSCTWPLQVDHRRPACPPASTTVCPRPGLACG